MANKNANVLSDLLEGSPQTPQSDGQRKTCEEAKKEFYSGVSGRTRAKRDSYFEISYEAYKTSCSSKNASRASAEISAPSRQKCVDKLLGSSSTSIDIGKTGLARVSTSQGCTSKQKQNGGLMKPASRVRRPKMTLGKKTADVNKKKPTIERIDESEFRNTITFYDSKKIYTTKQGLNKGCNAASSAKNASIVSKKPSATLEIYPEDVSQGRVLIREENDSEESDSEGIQIIDTDSLELLVPHQISCSMSKIGSSSKEKLSMSFSAAALRKDVRNVCRRECSSGYGESSYPVDSLHCSDHDWTRESRSFSQIELDSDDMKPEDIEFKGIDEAELRNQKSHLEPKMGRSAEQIFCSNKKVNGAKKNLSTLAGKVNNNEDTDPEVSRIEEITEAEFKYKRKLFKEMEKVDESKGQFITKIRPSTWQDSNGHFASTSAKNVKSVRRETVHDEEDGSSSSEFLDFSSSEFDSDDDNISLPDEEVSSCDAKHEKGPSIASRTRSKMGNIKKPPEVGNALSSLLCDSDSSPTDSGYHSSHDELESSHNEAESSDGGIEFLGLNLKACELQKYRSVKVSAETENDSKEGGESNCKQPENKENHEKAKHEPVSQFQNEDCSKEEDGAIEQSEESKCKQPENKKNYGKPKHKRASQFQKEDCNKKEDGAIEQSEESKREQPENKKNHDETKHESVSQFRKEDCSKEEDGIVEHALDGTNLRLSSRKRKFSSYNASSKPSKDKKAQKISKVSDACSMLADAILGRVQLPENKEDHREAEQVPASQSTLPLKFRFEDEVPEQVEKTEYEKDIEEQFSQLDYYWALEEMRSFDCAKVNLENGNSPVEDTQYARCCRGKHELVIEDEEGLICIYCDHVELGPKDVLPEWVEIPCRGSERRRLPEMEQLLEFDELHLRSSLDDDVADLKRATGTVWSIKPGVQESMYDHQREGFEFLWKNLAGSINLNELQTNDSSEVGGCIISHAPGTGKTRLTVVFLETYLKLFPNCYPVIIGPASMLLTWEEEFKKWNVEFPFLNLSNVELSARERNGIKSLAQPKSRDKAYIRMIKIFSWSKGRRILGISYCLFEKLTRKRKQDNLRKILMEKPGLVVLDEGHTPRNQRSSIWNSLLKLKTEKRVILSGTPFQNNFEELLNTLHLVRPAVAGVLSQEKKFHGMVATKKNSSRRKQKREHFQSCSSEEPVDHAAVEKLKVCMLPFVHVHKGAILQQSLPGLRDCVVLLKPPPLQKSLIERLEGRNTFKYEHDVALVSIHPYLFRHCDATKDQLIGIDMGAVKASKLQHQEGIKTRFIADLIRVSVSVNEKVLIFSQYIHPLELLKEQLKELFTWVEGRQILQMQGNVNLKQRQVLINQFNDPQSESKIMLASIKCCSEGINLIGASRVVLMDVVWNPSVERQAICRAYRIGQKKVVYTYHLMTCGTTEADKYCRQAEKERLSELVFSSSNESDKPKPSCVGFEDKILEVMFARESLNEMFEKIINQPKDTNLVQTFGLTS